MRDHAVDVHIFYLALHLLNEILQYVAVLFDSSPLSLFIKYKKR
jgi:hypothetical protein